MILVKKRQNQCIEAVIATYLELVYETSIKMIEVSTAFTLLICKKNINSKAKRIN
jgi:hypothetical protein